MNKKICLRDMIGKLERWESSFEELNEENVKIDGPLIDVWSEISVLKTRLKEQFQLPP